MDRISWLELSDSSRIVRLSRPEAQAQDRHSLEKRPCITATLAAQAVVTS